MSEKPTWGLYELQFATSTAQEARDRRVRQAADLLRDPSRAYRYGLLLCPICFYGSGLQAGIRKVSCRSCGEAEHDSQSILCRGCSERFGACSRCGADIDLKDRRKLERKK